MSRKWYGRMTDYPGTTGVVQWSRQRESLRLPEPILRRAHEEYASQHPGQSFERIQERGGFGVLEIVGLLADALGIDEVPE